MSYEALVETNEESIFPCCVSKAGGKEGREVGAELLLRVESREV